MKFIKDLIKKAENIAMIFFIVAMVCVTFLQVIARFVFNSPLSFSEELARYLFVWITFLGAAVAAREGAHFAVDAFVVMLPRTVQKLMGYASFILMLVFAFIMLSYGYEALETTHMQISPTLQVHMSFIYAAIPVSGGLMIFHILDSLIRFSRKEAGA